MSSHGKNKIIAGVMLALCALESVAFAGNPCDEYAALRAVLQTKREEARKAHKQLVKLDKRFANEAAQFGQDQVPEFMFKEYNVDKPVRGDVGFSTFFTAGFLIFLDSFAIPKEKMVKPFLFNNVSVPRRRYFTFVGAGLMLTGGAFLYPGLLQCAKKRTRKKILNLIGSAQAYDQEIKIAYEKVVELEIKHGCY